MRYKLFNNKANRTNRLAQKIGKRLDRENPKRKMHKALTVALSIVILFVGVVAKEESAPEWVLLMVAALLLVEEYFRLKNRAPRRLWREVMLISACSVAIFAFIPFAMWMDGEVGEQFPVSFTIAFVSLVVVSLALFIYAWMRMRRIKREIAEEKEQLWRRYERQKRLEKLNML